MEQRFEQYINAGHTSISNDLLLHYHDIGLDNDDFALYLQIQRIQIQGNLANPNVLAQVLHTTENVVLSRLKSLVKRGFVKIKGTSRQTETYDFSPLYDKLINGESHHAATPLSDGKQTRREILQVLEVEFGRPLSPMEMETVGHWFSLDKFNPEMVKLAIQEAIANNVRNLRYIETILVNWQKKNINTPQAAQATKEKRRGIAYTDGIHESISYDVQIPLTKLDEEL